MGTVRLFSQSCENGLLKRILAYVSKSILQLDFQLSQRFASSLASLALNEDGRKVRLLEPCDHHVIQESPLSNHRQSG